MFLLIRMVPLVHFSDNGIQLMKPAGYVVIAVPAVGNDAIAAIFDSRCGIDKVPITLVTQSI